MYDCVCVCSVCECVCVRVCVCLSVCLSTYVVKYVYDNIPPPPMLDRMFNLLNCKVQQTPRAHIPLDSRPKLLKCTCMYVRKIINLVKVQSRYVVYNLFHVCCAYEVQPA